MPRLFALLSGVKEYHPQSRVSSLTGCVNDVNNMEAYLKKRFVPEDLYLKKLLNADATRQSFIDMFTSHLINNPDIKPDDLVLFYHSGHGSYATSHAAFSEWDTERRDETLVLYDSRCAGSFDLADKELRLLLSRVPANAGIIVIVDACHSGSITRNIDDLDVIRLGKAKHAPARDNDTERKLSEYLTVNGEGYEQLLDGNGKAALPKVNCLSLTACDRTELAYEGSYSPEGMFTSMLLEALDAGPINLSYAQAYEHLYTLLKRRARQQTPQLEISGSINPDTVVFGNSISKGESVYEVVKEVGGKVTINCGALHGLKNDAASMKSMAISLYDKEDPAAPARLLKFNAIGLDKADLEEVSLSPKIYQAKVVNLPPVICIYVDGTTAEQALWKQSAPENEECLSFVYDKTQYRDYIVQFLDWRITLSHPATGEEIKRTAGVSVNDIFYMKSCCNKVCSWHQLFAMRNYAMTEQEFDKKFKTSFGIEVYNDETDKWEPQPENTIVYFTEKNKIPARLRLATETEPGWYCGVYYLNSRFGVQRLTNPSSESKVSKDQPLCPLPEGALLTIPDGINEVTDYVKLVISKTPFNDFLIKEFEGFKKTNDETGLGTDKDFVVPEKMDKEWYVKSISIKSVRNAGKIDGPEGYTSGKLTISQHDSLKGNANISSVPLQARSIHPSDQLRQFVQDNGFELINLGASKSDTPTSLVWINELDGDVSVDNPLKLTVKEIPAKDGGLVALTMEDGIIQVIGIGVPDEQFGGYLIDISALPEDQQRKKSLVRAAWFCFVKVVLRTDLSQLRRVVYENGKADYTDDTQDCVKPGMKVAVCIHGIIGNTKGIASAMEFLLSEKQYDLILAFDYENLNSKIEKIAKTFKKLLAKAGVSKDAPVDIISHSMGGLVSRYLIERLAETDGWVDRLFMFGTPNAGSVLGEIPKIRDWTVTILTLACNYGGSFLGAAGPVLSALNKVLATTKVATNSLAQMAVGSKFNILLNGPVGPVTTKYHIIAGNVLAFTPTDDSGRFEKIMEKIKRQIGQLLYRPPVKNDIAVGVDSILTMPEGISVTKKEIAGHHLNYFELDETIQYFKTLV